MQSLELSLIKYLIFFISFAFLFHFILFLLFVFLLLHLGCYIFINIFYCGLPFIFVHSIFIILFFASLFSLLYF